MAFNTNSIQATVGPKPPGHPFSRQGSALAYYIDGVAGKTIHLQRGNTYTFNINAPGHPFYLTTSDTGGMGAIGAIPGFSPTEVGVVSYTVPMNSPGSFYYQCATHPKMGGPIQVNGIGSQSKNFQQISRSIVLEPVIEDLVSPTVMAVKSSDPNAFYVGDQLGVIYRYDMLDKQVEVFADLSSYIQNLDPSYDERGILGLAFSPFDNSVFYVFLSGLESSRAGYSHDNAILEIDATTMESRIIYRAPHREAYHNGGNLVFGSDNLLYFGTGDAGPQKDVYGNSQNLQVPDGKILRMDVRQRNPTPSVYAYGIRNPWGISFDSRGRFFVADVGYESREEVNIIHEGFNGGWNYREGTLVTPFAKPSDRNKPYDPPIYEYRHHSKVESKTIDGPGANAIQKGMTVAVGGYYVDGIGYIFGDYSGTLFIIQEEGGKWKRVHEQSIPGFIKAFGRGPQGSVYVLTSDVAGPSGTTGKVSRLIID